MPKVKIPFNGPAYKGPSNNINAQECVNFIHNIDQQGGKGILSLIGRFGLDAYHTIGSEPIRGGGVVNNIIYFAAGNNAPSREENRSLSLRRRFMVKTLETVRLFFRLVFCNRSPYGVALYCSTGDTPVSLSAKPRGFGESAACTHPGLSG